MNRVETWPQALAALVEERRATPFVWGKHDCCAFAAEAVRRMTGLDLAVRAGHYRTAIGAVRAIHRFGADVESIPPACGFSEVPLALAQRGDVVSVDSGSEKCAALKVALGVCIGSLAAFASRDGLVFYPISECRKAWRI